MHNKNCYKHKNFLHIFTFSFFLFVLSCNNNQFYHSAIDIPSGSWNMDSAALFSTEIIDTAQKFDILLTIHHKNEYRYSNIWFFFKSISPDGYKHIDTIDIQLAERDGKWFGEKSGEKFKQKVFIKKQIRFPKQGKYSFEIIQAMRDVNLKGIYTIEFDLLETK